MRMLVTGQLAQQTLALMQYHDGTKCCRTCAHFVECDASGSANAKPAHCEINVFDVQVEPDGLCQHWMQQGTTA